MHFASFCSSAYCSIKLAHISALLTLVVRCGFPKPLTVDPLTISLVDSLLQSVFLCVKFSCLPSLTLKH